MSIATEIARLQSARNKLRTKAVALGIGAQTDKLDDLADEFNEIVFSTIRTGSSAPSSSLGTDGDIYIQV